ncbi:hypothetical protein EVA_02120 [gut metagenome]|uniref:Uncharacterized protein n=1 Tax=gut metagenome TaxID=749906 RepID=J9GNQ8_9ZZZZ
MSDESRGFGAARFLEHGVLGEKEREVREGLGQLSL